MKRVVNLSTRREFGVRDIVKGSAIFGRGGVLFARGK